ncbi:MAG: PKD domain-containing protein [bacterium]|nr:PKD domain-containing protein [bacterium]
MSSAQDPNHTYTTDGVYTVVLMVVGPGGNDTETKADYITVSATAPVAEFSASPTAGTAPLAVAFSDESTGTITSWSWSFGDGGTSSAQSPSHTYPMSGSYTVALTVAGPGGSGTETKIDYIDVNAAAPVAEFAGTPTSGTAPLSVSFSDLSTGEINGWGWDFGDGGTSTAQNPGHTYSTDGVYTVALTVQGPGGADSETKTGYITVSASTPVAEFSGSPTAGKAPLSVAFSDESTGTITSWSWSFGDGGSSSAQSPSHIYTVSGTYTVALTVIGPGGSDTETKFNYISADSTVPTAEFSGNPTSGIAPLTVEFSDESTGEIEDWFWNFGDGGSSTARSASYTYASAGTYTVFLTVVGPGGVDTETKVNYITVTSNGPTAGFSGAPTSGASPVTTFFTDLSTGVITEWLWDFGNGETSTEQNPFHDFHHLGPQTVSLTVTGPEGADTETKVAYVIVDPAPLGTNYCTTNPNSTGITASMEAAGSLLVVVNEVQLIARSLPLNEFGFFLASPTQGFIMTPGGSAGNFCLGTGPNLGRYDGFVQSSGDTGEFSLGIDLSAIPISVAPFSIALQPGDTWNFQGWFRDGQTSNFTDGLSVTFE